MYRYNAAFNMWCDVVVYERRARLVTSHAVARLAARATAGAFGRWVEYAEEMLRLRSIVKNTAGRCKLKYVDP